MSADDRFRSTVIIGSRGVYIDGHLVSGVRGYDVTDEMGRPTVRLDLTPDSVVLGRVADEAIEEIMEQSAVLDLVLAEAEAIVAADKTAKQAAAAVTTSDPLPSAGLSRVRADRKAENVTAVVQADPMPEPTIEKDYGEEECDHYFPTGLRTCSSCGYRKPMQKKSATKTP